MSRPDDAIRRLYVWPLLGWIGMLAVGYLPTRLIGGAAGVWAMVLAQGLVTAVVYGTLLPALRRMAAADPPKRFRIALQTGILRFILTLLISLAMLWRKSAEPAAFLIWLAVAYVVMTKLETWVLVSWIKRLDSD